jgi:nitrogen fixation NifU-like protein
MDFRDGTEIKEELEKVLLQELGDGISPILVDHIVRPRNLGTIEAPDGEATLSGICEDTVRIQFRLQGDRIEEIRFMTNGCGATLACGSMATEWARGKTLGEAMKVSAQQLIEALGGLPIESTHCAYLAANTLKAAARDALEVRRAPWKGLYRAKGGP